MGMDVVDLLNYLRLEGPRDEDLMAHTSDEDALTPRDDSADEGEVEPVEEDDPKEDPEEGLTKVERNQ